MWLKIFPAIVDPASKYAYIRGVEINPSQANSFLKNIQSSRESPGGTNILSIEENDSREKTGNASIFIEVAAFN